MIAGLVRHQTSPAHSRNARTGTYEATLLAALLNARRGASNKVLLTLVGGGVFGNERAWILQAIRRALRMVNAPEFEVILVSYGKAPEDVQALAKGA